MDLLELRKEIDKIDDKIIPLLLQRMDISKKVAEYKVERGIPVLNEQREKEILEDVARKCGEQGDTVKTVFSATMDASRALQHKIIGGGKELRESINKALEEKLELSQISESIACAGVEGAYASMAASEIFPNAEIKYYKQFEDVFKAVNDGSVSMGVIPVENSTAGSVHEVYDCIVKYRFYVVGACDLKVEHCLCTKKDTDAGEIKTVYSHPQGLSQCDIFLKEKGYIGTNYSNTAAAAKYVSESSDNSIAAICSVEAAKKYGLKIVERNIQNIKLNKTRFLVISKKLVIEKNADKISLIFSLPHTTGSLYRVLGRFSMAGLNLTKIESRPLESSDFSYYFYIDLMGSVQDEKTLDLLCALSSELPEFSFLGNFREIMR